MNKFLVSVAAVAVLMPMLALGATFTAGEEVSISSGDTLEDSLYIAGGNVSVTSPVMGDLMVAGGNILVSENVTEDLTAAGGSLTVLGDTGGDLRIAGGNILVAGTVGGDLVGAGGSLTVAPDVTVGKDLVLAGGQMLIDGTVAGDVEITGGIATISGHVQGNVIAHLDDKLTIANGATIDGNIVYSANTSEKLVVDDGATVAGEVVFNEVERPESADVENIVAAAVGTFMFVKFIVLLVTALVLVWLFKRFSNDVVEGAAAEPLRMFGYGFVALVVVPVALILLLVTLFGAALGLVLALAYLLLLLVAGIYSGVVAGAWLSQLVYKSHAPKVTWKNVIVGVLVLTLVKLVPVVGWIIGLMIFLITLGSIAQMLQKKVWAVR